MYIVVELQKNSDGSLGNIVTSYNNLMEAESKFHSILAAAAISKLPVHSAAILNEHGMVQNQGSYEHEVDMEATNE